MTKIPAHPKICDGSARLPRPGSLLSACSGVSFCLDKFFHCVVSSGYLVIVAFQSPKPPETHGNRHIQTSRVLQPLGVLNDEPRDLTPKSNATSCSCWVRSSQRFIDCQVRIQVTCCGGGTDQPPPVVPSPVLPGPCPVLLLDRSSFITTVEAGLFRASWWDPIRGSRSRVGGAGKGH